MRAQLAEPRDLRSFLERAGRFDLAPGYPWLAGTGGQREVVVVLARFAERDDAARWKQEHLPPITRFRVLPAFGEGEGEVVMLERDADAYDEATALSLAMSAREDPAMFLQALRRAPGKCRVTAGSIHAFHPEPPRKPRPGLPPPPDPEISLDGGIRPALQPVRCPSGEKAWVLAQHTRAASAVYVDEDGGAWLRQLLGMTCGSMATVTWRWSNGKRSEPRLQAKRCEDGAGLSIPRP